jgi:hypothetical protein
MGATGSGKTQAACWHLASSDFDQKPWIIFDFKGDELINEIEGAQHIDVNSAVPKHPGIYIVHPHPADDESVEALLWRIWEAENTGVYIDEAYQIDRHSRAMRGLFTQGRSKRIPMIVLTQRPTWVSRFVLSEASYYRIFRLQDKRDWKIALECVSDKFHDRIETEELPSFYSWYYGVKENELWKLRPVPDADVILDMFRVKMQTIKKIA